MRARGPGQSVLLLLDVAAVLANEEIEYAVIGAMAASVHGSIRATTDADALVSASASKLARLQRAFKKARFNTDLRHGDADDPIAALLAVADKHGNRVDLLAGLRGLDTDAFSRSITVPFPRQFHSSDWPRGFHRDEVLRWRSAGCRRCAQRTQGCGRTDQR